MLSGGVASAAHHPGHRSNPIAVSATTSHPIGDNPSAFGYPDATNTGYLVPLANLKQVPQQIKSGPGWQYANGVLSITKAGTVLNGITTAAMIDVRAANVTITTSRVYGALTNSPGIALERGANNTHILNTLIAGTNGTSGGMLVGVKDVYGDPVTGTLIDKCNIYNASSGVQIYAGTVQNSYIHDLSNTGSQHLEDFNSTGNSGFRLVINHNTLFNRQSQTAAVYLGADFSPSQNVAVSNNLLAGGGYTVYGGGLGVGSQADPMDITVTGNVFSSLYFANGGYWGPVAYFDAGNGDVWSGNVWDGSGAVVNP
jgi:hypothetical protein